MRIVSTTRILDEADIVEAFVRHTSSYVDHLIFLDNGSSDGTVDILRRLKEEGIDITVFENRSVYYNEMNFNTFMFREAVEKEQADWVFCLDCDEFIDDRGLSGGLRNTLESKLADLAQFPAIEIPIADYRLTEKCDYEILNITQRMVYRDSISDTTKVFLRKDLNCLGLVVGGGNHDAHIFGQKVPSTRLDGLHLAHFPTRNVYQFSAKYVKGWAKVLAAGEEVVNRGTSSHYREVFGIVKNDPSPLLDPARGRVLSASASTFEYDPIDYRGDQLKYTSKIDDIWRCIRSMTGYIEDLAIRHGKLISESTEARCLTDDIDTEISKIV